MIFKLSAFRTLRRVLQFVLFRFFLACSGLQHLLYLDAVHVIEIVF